MKTVDKEDKNGENRRLNMHMFVVSPEYPLFQRLDLLLLGLYGAVEHPEQLALRVRQVLHVHQGGEHLRPAGSRQ